MGTSFLFTLFLLLFGPLCVAGLTLWLPVAVAIHWGFAAVLSAVFSEISFGWGKLAGIYLLSGFFTNFVLAPLPFSRRKIFGPRFYFFLSGIVALLSLDLALIYLSSGWGPVPHFRPPFLHDIERDVVIVNALLRHAGSPYLPNSPFGYQLLWYHWASLPVSLFEGSTSYPFVIGTIHATGVLFLSFLLWAVCVLRPAVAMRWGVGIFLCVLFFSHTDLFNGIRSVIMTGRWGIETDLPAGFPIFFRYSSLKSLTLVAPQHAFGLSFLIFYFLLGQSRVVHASKKREIVRGIYGILAFAASPILFGMVMPLFLLWELATGKLKLFSVMKRAAAFLGGGTLLFRLVCGFWPTVLLSRPDETRALFPSDAESWVLYFPWLWIATLGLPVILWFICLTYRLLQRHRRNLLSSPELWAIAIGVPFFCYIYAHSEIRRYYSLLCVALLFLSTVRLMPHPRLWLASRPMKFVVLGFSGAALFLHGVFLHSYLFRPSTVDQTIPWEDYFGMNQIIKDNYSHLPVMAAADNRLGIEKPLVMQVTTSFCAPVEIAIHTQLTKNQFNTLEKIFHEGNPLPYARSLGYEAILWGPVEERVWGSSMREKYLREDRKIATVGSVSLYRMIQ
jgi:hypothetical protein